MSRQAGIEITDTAEYGVILKCRDVEVADRFEDFLTERCFVLFQMKFDSEEVSFLFGQASSPSKVGELFDRFLFESGQN